MIIVRIILGIAIIYLIINILIHYIQKYKFEQSYVYLIEYDGVVSKRLKHKPGLTHRIPKKSESILVADKGDYKIKEFLFKNIRFKGSYVGNLENIRDNFVIYQNNGKYYIKYCTEISLTGIGFNDLQYFPPKKEVIGISGNLCYGFTYKFTVIPTTSRYRLKDIKLICYGYSRQKYEY
jgi:hypothetical protein